MAEKEPNDRYDVVVVGGGPAGLAAAIYTARQGLSTAIIAGELGGQPQWASHVENYLGFEFIAGSELADRFRAHARGFDIDTFEGRYADAVIPSDRSFEVHSREGLQLRGRALIIASGRAPVRLSVPGEKELVGRGVSYCAYCDAAFFRGRPVAVIGPGESAAEAALQLAALDARVILVSEHELRAPQVLLEKLEADPRVEMRTGLQTERIEGEDHVTALVVRDDEGGELSLPVDAVFIEAGSIPAGEFTGGLVRVNDAGEVEVGRDLMTSRPGIFAAGDVTDAPGKQIIIAAGDGARAGVAAAKWLQRQET